MKRTPLRPSLNPIARSELPRARKPIKARGKPRFKGRVDEAFREYIRGLPCVCDISHLVFVPPESEIGWILFHKPCSGPIECAHLQARSTGGADRGNMVPLCRGHHREQHTIGMKSFCEKYFRLVPLAELFTERYEVEIGGPDYPAEPGVAGGRYTREHDA